MLMKRTLIQSIQSIAAVVATAFFVSSVRADDRATPQSVRAHGTITSNTPDTLVIRSEKDAAPVTYAFTKETEYVDENGRPISVEVVHSGTPVDVQYTQEGNRLVARRVTVYAPTAETQQNKVDRPLHKTEVIRQKPDGTIETKSRERGDITTHALMSHGTINARTPDQFVVQSQTETNPVTYTYTSSTQYVNEHGQPVSVETVKSGVPVTVEYERDGNHMRATRVIVHESATGR
jgi:hypothetical protein